MPGPYYSCSSADTRRLTRSCPAPVARELRDSPAGVRAPVLPASRKRRGGKHALAFCADRGDLGGCETTLPDPILHFLLVFPAPRPIRTNHEIELVILRLEHPAVSYEWRLEVHVPAGEAPLRLLPEVPDRVSLARAKPDKDAVAGPRSSVRPWVLSLERASLGRRSELRSFGEVDHGFVVAVSNDADRQGRVRLTAPPLTPDDELAGLPLRIPHPG